MMQTDGILRGATLNSVEARRLLSEIGNVGSTVSAATLSRWVRCGFNGKKLPCRRFGKRLFFFEQDVRDFGAILTGWVE